MLLKDAQMLVTHPYLPMETGWTRLDDGQIYIAARTPMPGCTGKMIDWWFGFVHHIEEYMWWHPRDHIWSGWDGERGTGRYIGGSHLVHEYIGGRLAKLRINFRDPAGYFDTSAFAAAHVSTAICARGGDLDSPKERPVWNAHLIHFIQDTEDGCVMRSRFWLGDIEGIDAPVTPQLRREVIPDAFGQGLLQHCCEEMALLAGFLPTVYRLYNRPQEVGNPHACPNG